MQEGLELEMHNLKGVILAGGEGTRLKPLTKCTSKQLLPVFDKPMIFYPISTLMLAGVKDFLIITNEKYNQNFKDLLGDGSKLGVRFSYKIQENPDGLAAGLKLSEPFFDDYDTQKPFVFALGDNILITDDLQKIFTNSFEKIRSSDMLGSIFSIEVRNPEDFGVVEFNDEKPISLIEKPKDGISNWAIPGFYIYSKEVFNLIDGLSKSDRGELEITDLNKLLLEMDKLDVRKFGRSTIWYDAGTIENLNEINQIITNIFKRTGNSIGCLEEIAIKKGFIKKDKLFSEVSLENSDYFNYVKNLQ